MRESPKMKSVLRAVIIDDEPLARIDLRYLLDVHPEIRVIGEAGSIIEAERLFSRTIPDVVFLDIELRGCSGFDLLPCIPPASQIIFFTSHEEYAVRAFEVNALDYLLKPVAADRLAAALSRIRSDNPTERPSIRHQIPYERDDRIYIRNNCEHRFIIVDTIVAVTSIGGNYTALNFVRQKRIFIRRSLKEWQRLLPKEIFYRIHRSAIANLYRIESLRKGKDGCLRAFFPDMPESLMVSRRSETRLKELLDSR